ncbi:MAG: futalosine hydrolase [Bacteroidia bacterium]|nr:futalosine hydrolase [Bacteroidia bacterium]
MKILAVLATKHEVYPFIQKLGFTEKKNEQFFSGIYQNINIDILITGIGCHSTIYFMCKTLQKYNYDLLLNAGIAGSYTKEIHIGTVVNVIEDQFIDLGIEENGKFFSLFEKKYLAPDEFPFDDGVLRNTSKISSITFQKMIKALGATSNTVHENRANIAHLLEKYCLDIETMEGAAFFYVALIEKIPFIQIRAVSNYVENRNENNWNIPLAIENLSNTLISILNDLIL